MKFETINSLMANKNPGEIKICTRDSPLCGLRWFQPFFKLPSKDDWVGLWSDGQYNSEAGNHEIWMMYSHPIHGRRTRRHIFYEALIEEPNQMGFAVRYYQSEAMIPDRAFRTNRIVEAEFP